jgi:hypothetical protein
VLRLLCSRAGIFWKLRLDKGRYIFFQLRHDGRQVCHGSACCECWFSDPAGYPTREAPLSLWAFQHTAA